VLGRRSALTSAAVIRPGNGCEVRAHIVDHGGDLFIVERGTEKNRPTSPVPPKAGMLRRPSRSVSAMNCLEASAGSPASADYRPAPDRALAVRHVAALADMLEHFGARGGLELGGAEHTDAFFLRCGR